MFLRFPICAALVVVFAVNARADEPNKVTPADARKAAERGLVFVQKDAEKWRKERECATCHHGTMTVWAFSEAKNQGYPIDKEAFDDVLKWTKDRFLKDIEKPRDTRPGWMMVSTPAVLMSTMSLAIPRQDSLSKDDLKKMAGHLVRHQETDGSWAWSLAPAKNRPPPVFESDEVVTLMAFLALAPHVPADANEKSDARTAREKADAWLAKNPQTETTQSLALWLFRAVLAGSTEKELQPRIDRLIARQNKDGGWGQLKEAPSDAYATGQALYFLNIAGVKRDSEAIQRGLSFLVGSQKEDGSWPMKGRGHPGEKGANNLVPITYFGSAWATLGIMRSVPR